MRQFSDFRRKPSLRPYAFAGLFVLGIVSGAIFACRAFSLPDFSALFASETQAVQTPSGDQSLAAQVTFIVEVPPNTPPGEAIQLTIVDEITGLPYNQQHNLMQAQDAYHYSVTLQAPLGSMLKYRYTRFGDTQIPEYTAGGEPVRYRLYNVDGPGLVQDYVARWSDTLIAALPGRIIGEIMDAQTGEPIPNLMVVAGGARAFTQADGSFLIQHLSPGKHTLVAYSPDGSYLPFKHEALVASDSATPVTLELQPTHLVPVTFHVTVPKSTVDGVPLRIAGNLHQLGNTFADLEGGLSALANRMPRLTHEGGDTYAITLPLPAGVDLRYKYTLGDGLWNAEHDSAGAYVLRSLLIPTDGSSFEVDDRVIAWETPTSTPIEFNLTAPPLGYGNGAAYLQFQLFDWMAPLPMWANQDGSWTYTLYSPTNFAAALPYRYCRAAQCGLESGIAIETSISHRAVSANLQSEQSLFDEVAAWQWLDLNLPPASVLGNAIYERGQDFLAGVEFSAGYHPSWDAGMSRALADVGDTNSNTLILTPTWTFTNQDPPNLELVPGQDMLWSDLSRTIQQTQAAGLRVAVFPQVNFPASFESWWLDSERGFSWWQVWFERYRSFVLYHAELAERQGIDIFILGGDWLMPALPGGELAGGESSNVPLDALARWQSLVDDLRDRYSGRLGWALPYPGGIENPPAFLDKLDFIYLLWAAPLTDNPNAGVAELEQAVGDILDQEILVFQLQVDMPLVLAVSYPSAQGGVTGCIPAALGDCLSFDQLFPPSPSASNVDIDLQEQVEVYNALLSAVNERAWITGFVSRGYYPPLGLMDLSTSVHGKPAADVLGYWFKYLLGLGGE